jgi:hypothetical protein
MNNKKFDLYIETKDCKSFEVTKEYVLVSGVEVESFMFPDTMDCDNVAEILSKEDEVDLQMILDSLKKKLHLRDCKFTFKLKGKTER